MSVAQEALTGSKLDAWLDQVEQTINAQEEAGNLSPELRQSTILSLLEAQTCAPDEANALFRLKNCWCYANQPDTALALLAQFAPAVLAQMSPEERADYEVHIACWRVSAWRYTTKTEETRQALLNVAQFLEQMPPEKQILNAWHFITDQAYEISAWDLVRQFASARLIAQHANKEQQQWQAWEEAMMHISHCQSFNLAGEHEKETLEAANKAIETLQNAGEDQSVEMMDWINLGNILVDLTPSLVPRTVLHARQCVEKEVPATKRDAEVHIARLEARTFYAEGALEKAISRAQDGRYALANDADDRFSAELLAWLIEAGKEEDAARLCFDSADGQRDGSEIPALELALAKVANKEATPNVYWHLALAGSTLHESQGWVCGDADPKAFYQTHLAKARALAPDHPALLWLEIKRVIDKKEGTLEQALPLLEAFVANPESRKSPGLSHFPIGRLLIAQAKVYGIEKALAMPPIAADAAEWNYYALNQGDWEDAGIKLNEEMSAKFKDLDGWHYEQGLAQYEAFFASGKGHFRDANKHTYSMLCNDLGIYYRSTCNEENKEVQCARALALHQKGIDASDFAEHFHSIVSCYHTLNNNEELINAAEALWHYANDYGFSRHAPTRYFKWVSIALYATDREFEAGLWLERLDEWYRAMSEADLKEYANEVNPSVREDYVLTSTHLLKTMANVQPEDALERLQARMEGVEKFKNVDLGIPFNVGVLFYRADKNNEAIAWYKFALDLANREGNEAGARTIRESMDEAQEALNPPSARPWWKFWG